MKKIAIDIGHARGTGAVGITGENEHDISARVARLLAGLLKQCGHRVDVLDFPDLSNTADLNATVQAVNAGGYDFCVSLHCDSAESSAARGAHVCYVSEPGRKLAAAIAAPLCELMPGRADKTVKRTNLAILNQTRPPAVLVEMGFVTNAADAAMQKNQAHSIAQCICNGILAFINSQ